MGRLSQVLEKVFLTPQPSGALGVLERPPRMGLPLSPQFTGSKTEEESKANLP